MFGIQPMIGRTFVSADDELGAPPVLVLSYDYWRNSLGSDPAIVGKTFEMNDKLHTVVGVLPPVPQYAPGAKRENIFGMILGQGAMLASLGILIGAAGALALTTMIKSLLFEVTPSDPATFLSVAFVLGQTAIVAS
jgi:hypothetical protein